MSTPATTVGRPPLLPEDERKALILQAAEQVFAATGYGDATMEEIARACGMAKKTVYKFFPDKAALFGALVDSHEVLRDSWTSRPRADASPRDRLRQILLELSSFILSPRQIALTRLVIAEAHKSPELAERFYGECVEKTLSFLARELELESPDPQSDAPDIRLVADMFLGATLGALQLKVLMLNFDPETLARELKARVELASEMMLQAFDARRR